MQFNTLINKLLSKKNIRIIFIINIIFCIIFILFLAFFINTKLNKSFTLITSNSIGKKIILTQITDKNLELKDLKNKIVIIEKTTPYSNKHFKHIAKYIKCVEGDILKVTKEKEYFCNDIYLGFAQNTNSKGKEIKNFVFNGAIPKNKFFAMGTHLMSYDSRYFGFIDKTQIVRNEVF